VEAARRGDDDAGAMTRAADVLTRVRDADPKGDGIDGIERLVAADRTLALRHTEVKRALVQAKYHQSRADEVLNTATRVSIQAQQAYENARREAADAEQQYRKVVQLPVAWREAAGDEPALSFIATTDLARTEAAQAHAAFDLSAVLADLAVALQRNGGMRDMAIAQGIHLEPGRALIGQDDRTPDAVIGLWRAVRRTCLAFMPSDLAQSEDPMRAVAELSRRVRDLEVKLAGAEDLYRQGIEALMGRINRAVADNDRRITRLNAGRSRIAFGDFTGVRLSLRKNKELFEEAAALLRDAAEMQNTTGEMGLAEAFAAADRKRNNGHHRGVAIEHYLDYRHYVEVAIDVRRTGSEDWIPIERSGASTGESMGLGFTCLLMILAAWEHEDNAERGQGTGTLRLLITDEAGRLDERGLSTMAQLARDNGACVIMAAPDDLSIKGAACIYTLARAGSETVHSRVVRDPVAVGRTRLAVEASPARCQAVDAD
jgi:chromosome condensin MukBEF ATPase and DNA-binding subunit MukB